MRELRCKEWRESALRVFASQSACNQSVGREVKEDRGPLGAVLFTML